jgi:hypothetical protein
VKRARVVKRARLGDVVRYRGELCEVVAIGEGTTVIMSEIGKPDCPACGRRPHHEMLEHSRIFQDEVKAVHTVETT